MGYPHEAVDIYQGSSEVSDSVPFPVKLGTGETITLAVPTSGGWDFECFGDVDESEEEVKASAGILGGILAINLDDEKRWLKIYDAAAADVTVGTTATVIDLPIPTLGDTNGAGFIVKFDDFGLGFDNGICIAATTGQGDADSGAPGANEVVVLAWYK